MIQSLQLTLTNTSIAVTKTWLFVVAVITIYTAASMFVGFPVRMLCINWIILYLRWNLGIILVYKNRFNFNFNFLFNFFMKIIATSKFAVLISLAGMFSSKPEQNSFMFPSITATRSTTWPHSISQSKWTHSCLNELNMKCGCLKIWNFSWSVQLDITKERNSTSISNHVLYIVYCINTIGLNWQEKSTLSMIEKKGPQSTNKIVKHVGNMAQDEKQFLN